MIKRGNLRGSVVRRESERIHVVSDVGQNKTRLSGQFGSLALAKLKKEIYLMMG